MDWLKVTIHVDPESKETILGKMLDLGAGGVEEVDPGALLSLISEVPKECRPDNLGSEVEGLIAYWPDSEVGRGAAKALEDYAGQDRVQVEVVSDTQWLTSDTVGFTELKVGRRWLVVSEDEILQTTDGRMVIYLRPGQAFGTGMHTTTQLALEMLEKVPVIGKALDAGTGSGILTIALKRLGFAQVFACDIDPTAVQVAQANLTRNQVQAEVFCADPSQLEEKWFSLIVANILADVIIGLAPTFRGLSTPRGMLVASGIVAARAPEVIAALDAAGFELIERRERENWIALLVRVRGEEQ